MKNIWIRNTIVTAAVIIVTLALAFFLLPVPGVIPVLFYHFVGTPEHPSKLFVSKKAFERQLAFLKYGGYRVLSLDEFYAVKTGKMKPPRRAVVLTFDDCSNWCFYCTALPIIEKYKLPVANFMVYDCALNGTQDSMSFKQAREAIKKGVTIGSHSINHPHFNEIDVHVLRNEIFESKRLLEKELGVTVEYFSYPFGVYTPQAAEFVKEAGYRMAFVTGKAKAAAHDLYAVPRAKVSSSSENLFDFWFRVSGLYGALRNLKH
ncbi:MAG: polysaccharide deacetylase family protein [Candidatus Omnitrophica bacterium]|nr:polysaccharide deacetylase family protein [Candidatus Omnitrophota bacterium]